MVDPPDVCVWLIIRLSLLSWFGAVGYGDKKRPTLRFLATFFVSALWLSRKLLQLYWKLQKYLNQASSTRRRARFAGPHSVFASLFAHGCLRIEPFDFVHVSCDWFPWSQYWKPRVWGQDVVLADLQIASKTFSKVTKTIYVSVFGYTYCCRL